MQAEEHDAGVVRLLMRVLCLAGCGLGLAFVLALLAPGSGTADAAAPGIGHEDQPGPSAAGIVDRSAATEAAVDAAASPLWAEPATIGDTAMRRATPKVEPTPEWSLRPSVDLVGALDGSRASNGSNVAVRATSNVPAMSTPIGSFGSGGGGPDTGPSISQLAVLSAALIGVLWLSQWLRASQLSWRSTYLTLSIERPG